MSDVTQEIDNSDNTHRTSTLRTDKDPICLAPFVGVFIAPARMSPCCEMATNGYSSIDELWNSDLMKHLRVEFTAGRTDNLPQYCTDCIKSSTSHRDFYYLPNRKHFKQNYYKNKGDMSDDGTMSSIAISYLAIGISNKCNFACRICYPGISSTKHKYADEKNLIPVKELLSEVDSNYEVIAELDYTDIISNHSDTIDEIIIHGGDPTQHKNLPHLLDVIIKNIRPETKVVFLSNGSFRLCADGETIWEKLKPIKNLNVVFSMDGDEVVNEYTRINCNHSRLVKLIWEAKDTLSDDVYIGIHSTISNMSIVRYCEFLKYYKDTFSNYDIWLSANVVNGPLKYHPSNIPPNIKGSTFIELKNLHGTLNDWHMDELIEMAILSLNKNEYNETLWNDFIKEELIMDEYSNYKLFDVYPEFKS